MALPNAAPITDNKLELAQVLFTDIVGYSRLPAEAQLEAIASLQETVRSLPDFERGVTEQRVICLPTGDGIAIVCFGEPLLPFRFALGIDAALRANPIFGLRMGLHSGPAFRHLNINSKPDTAGPAINIAQRVMDCGDAGHILASEDYTTILVQLREFSPAIHALGEFTVKHSVVLRISNLFTEEYGNADRPSKLHGHSDSTNRSADSDAPPDIAGRNREEPAVRRIPLIGRDAELDQLTKQLDEALAGRGSLVLIGGEPGIGKTHLVSALAETAGLRGAITITGHCYEMEGSPPYVPVIEHLEQGARMVPADMFRGALGDDAPEVARLMPELRRMFPDIPPALELPPEQQRRFLFNAYRSFIERSARSRPIVALFEDLHWADEPTLLLIQHLAQAVSGTPLLMVGTYRDVDLEVGRPLARTMESLMRQKLATRISLRRLTVAGVEQMLAALSAQQPPASLASVVFEETEGNPFFVEEVFRHLAEEGRLFDAKGVFREGLRVDQLQVPESVRLVLGRRLDRLSEGARRILTTAAVIGRVFPLELLEDLEKARPDAALEAVEEAERVHLVETHVVGRQTRYRFVHELVRQTLAETLSLPRRQRLHARVAEALERVYQTSIEAHLPALAHHLYQAGTAADVEKTVYFLSEAAKRAVTAAAHEEALDHLNNALSLLEDERSARIADLHARKASVLGSLSRHREAVQEYELALALFDSLGDHAKFIDICFLLWCAQYWFGEFQEGGAVADRAAVHAVQATARERYVVLAMQACSASTVGEMDRALDLLGELQTIPEGDLTPDVIALASVCESHARHHTGQYRLCEAAARKAQRIFEQIGDLWWQTDVQCGPIIASLHCGQPAEAEKLILQAIPRAARIGHDSAKGLELLYLGAAYIDKGDLEGADRVTEETLEFAERHLTGWTFLPQTLRGCVLLYRGQTGDALTLLAKATAVPPTCLSGYADGLLALAMAATAPETAADACNAAMRFLPRPGASRGLGVWYAVLSLTQALRLSGRSEEAAGLLTEAEKIAAEWDCNDFGFPVRTAAGIAAACAGKWDGAEEHHRAAIMRMDEVPYVTAQPIARYWYADMLGERGGAGDTDAAATLLEDTIVRSDAIGLELYAGLARQRLTQLEGHVKGVR